MNETIVIQPTEVGRIKMPVPLTDFCRLTEAFEKTYGPGLLMRQHGPWAIFVTPEPQAEAAAGAGMMLVPNRGQEASDAAQGVPTNKPGAD